jgi:hypothetical protein
MLSAYLPQGCVMKKKANLLIMFQLSNVLVTSLQLLLLVVASIVKMHYPVVLVCRLVLIYHTT